MPTFLIAGGTGNVGSACARALSAAGATVRIFTRDPSSKSAGALATLPGVALLHGDFLDVPTLTAAFDGVDAAFLGCSNFLEQVAAEKNVIDAAAASTTCKYLVKLGTAGPENYTAKDSVIEYGRFHAEIEEHLAKQTTLEWTVLRPNIFMQNHLGDIFGTLPLGIIAYPFSPEVEARPIDTRDIGDLAAKLLLLSSEERAKHVGKIYDVSGPETVSMAQLASWYTSALKRDIKAVTTSTEEWTSNAEKAGFPAWLAKAVSLNYANFFGKGLFNYPSSPEVLELLPPHRKMIDWVSEHAPLSPPPAAS